MIYLGLASIVCFITHNHQKPDAVELGKSRKICKRCETTWSDVIGGNFPEPGESLKFANSNPAPNVPLFSPCFSFCCFFLPLSPVYCGLFNTRGVVCTNIKQNGIVDMCKKMNFCYTWLRLLRHLSIVCLQTSGLYCISTGMVGLPAWHYSFLCLAQYIMTPRSPPISPRGHI